VNPLEISSDPEAVAGFLIETQERVSEAKLDEEWCCVFDRSGICE
jgi:hypothetical protein